MITLTTAIQIELRKLASTRTAIVTSAVAVALAAVVAALTVAGVKPGGQSATDVFSGALVGSVQTAYLLTAIAGITVVAGEFRHRTATASYLAVPRRGTVIAAKLAVLLGYGLAVGLVVMAVCSAISVPWLAHRGFLHGGLSASGVARTMAGGTAAIAIVTLIGAGLGALLRNQLIAMAGLALYLFALEPALASISGTRSGYPYLPGGAVQALAFTGHRAFGSPTGAALLSPWLGAALLSAYGLGLTAVAVRTSISRDIT